MTQTVAGPKSYLNVTFHDRDGDMKKIITVSAALALTTTAATAGDLDRSGQNITAIFEDGSYAEFSFGTITPPVSGADLGGSKKHTGNVA